jgi:hypothetical protein
MDLCIPCMLFSGAKASRAAAAAARRSVEQQQHAAKVVAQAAARERRARMRALWRMMQSPMWHQVFVTFSVRSEQQESAVGE